MARPTEVLGAIDGFGLAGSATALAAIAPIVALAVIAFGGDGELWRHLFSTVVPRATIETAILAAGVAAFVGVVGTGTAWIVATRDFPGRRVVEVLLLLPLAFPAYVLAYSWLDLLHPIGPIQSTLRAILGYERPADFRLPEVRSLPGAILIFGLALYPYVYVATRGVFLARTTTLVEAARMLGARPSRVFFRVALPLARPAIAAGAALAVMETLNDVGAAEFLSVNTLTTAVYSTWVNRSDLPGAAQIALAMLAFVLGLLLLERLGRGERGYAVFGRAGRPMGPRPAEGAAGFGLFLVCLLPSFFGFVLPAAHLLRQAWERLAFAGLAEEIVAETVGTILLAASATVIGVTLAALLVSGRRLHPDSRPHGLAPRIASVGYAVPGTVLAIGLLVVYGAFDTTLRATVVALGGAPTGLVISASFAGLVIALVLRFFRLAASKIETGLERISPSLEQSARMLGRGPFGAMRAVHLPLLTPAYAGAALLFFVDCMKELPATLLLRPLGFETLSTRLYGEAARGTYENGALAACLIVAFGLLPIILMTRIGRLSPVPTTSAAEGEPA
ncbi:MAG: iron ABC transporter permease [Siculibacillus sp.]|nr:iron ABC transporter permease [Siculibacillus sp.]